MELYLPIAELPINVLLVLAMAGAVGFVSGLFGVGGGFLITPLLIFVGIPPAVAVASGAPGLVASATTGSLGSWRRKALDPKLGAVLAGGGLLGTWLGVAFFNAMRRLGQLELVVALAYAVLLGVVGSLMLAESLRALRDARRGAPARPHRGGWGLGLPYVRMAFPRSGIEGSLVPIVGLAVGVGFLGAVLGVGGGFMLVPALIYGFGVPTAVVVGTSLFQILVTMLGATLLHAVTNHSVDAVLALVLVLGSVVGTPLGARMGRKLPNESFRLLLAVLILGVAARFAFELVASPGEPFSVVESRAGAR